MSLFAKKITSKVIKNIHFYQTVEMQSQITLFCPRDLPLQPRFVRLLLGSHPIPPPVQ